MSGITLLDGAVGQELVNRAGDPPTPLWSTQTMIDHPDLLREVHDAYFAAGATVATTNSYTILQNRLQHAGLQGQMAPLMDMAVTAARTARDAAGHGRIAGAIGPLLASYRPDICPPPDKAENLYERPMRLLGEHGVDLLLLETMASTPQAEGALRAASRTGLPVWLAVTVQDEDGTRLRSGEALDGLAPLIERFRPDAVLINCTRPEAVAPALDILKTFDRPFGAYANGFTAITQAFLQDGATVDALSARTDLAPTAYADFAMEWVDQGASIVGGCCEIGPDHIAELARRLRAAGHMIT